MFRTAVRQFAWTARRAAGTVEKLSVAEIDAAYRHGIDISKAQGVAKRGLVDGTVLTAMCFVKI
jgi:cysteine synthase A